MGYTNIFRYRINGLIDTNRSVLENLEAIANSAGAWVSYDIQEGKWAVVINRPRAVDADFTDDNIIGGINVTTTNLTDTYNAVEVQYPNNDILDQADWIVINIPPGLRNPNEPDNQLSLTYPLVSELMQAQLLGYIELRQARLNQTVQFETDYSYISLEAGHVITITNSLYGWTQKQFRVMMIEEIEDEAGLRLRITGLEYDTSIYSTDDLYRYERINADGIISIGAIGTPSQPIVTKIETNARPRIEVSTFVPDNTDPTNEAGIVTGMEFWFYEVPDSELPTWEFEDDSLRDYKLLETVVENNGAPFAPGREIILDVDHLNLGNFLVKVRAINDTTTSLFSLSSGLVDYQPLQVTDAVGPNTKILDANGNVIGSGAPLVVINSGLVSNVSCGQSAGPDAGNAITFLTTTSFVPVTGGFCKIDILVDQNFSSAVGGRGYEQSEWNERLDVIFVNADLIDVTANTIVTSTNSGGAGAQAWTDFAVTALGSLTAGNTYQIVFSCVNYTDDGDGGAANFDISWNIFGASPN